jgi:hypothetical protein
MQNKIMVGLLGFTFILSPLEHPMIFFRYFSYFISKTLSFYCQKSMCKIIPKLDRYNQPLMLVITPIKCLPVLLTASPKYPILIGRIDVLQALLISPAKPFGQRIRRPTIPFLGTSSNENSFPAQWC